MADEHPRGTVVARPTSSRDPDLNYEVCHKDGAWTCNCPGYANRSSCRHVTDATDQKLTTFVPPPAKRRPWGDYNR